MKKIQCTNCGTDQIIYQEIREIKETSIGVDMCIFAVNQRRKTLHAIYWCPECKAISAYEIGKRDLDYPAALQRSTIRSLFLTAHDFIMDNHLPLSPLE